MAAIFNKQIFNEAIFNTEPAVATPETNPHSIGGVSFRELRRRSRKTPAPLEILIALPLHGTAYTESLKKLKIKGTAKLTVEIKKQISGKSSRYTSEILALFGRASLNSSDIIPISGTALGKHIMALRLRGKKDYKQVINIFNDFLRLDIEEDYD